MDASTRDKGGDNIKIRHFSRRKIEEYVTHENLSGQGTHADKIKILINPKSNDHIVKKAYNKKRANIFFNEVYWLLTLYKTNLFPKIIRIDTKTLTFWMTYCGRTLSEEEFKGHEKSIKNIEEFLLKNYKCFHNDIKCGNVCIKKGKKGKEDRLYLIDCGWMDTQKILPGYTKGRHGDLFPNCFSDMKEKCLELLNKKTEITTSEKIVK